MNRTLTVAALQTAHDWSRQATVDRVLSLAHAAADRGAQVILPSELFETPYFCKTANPRYREMALVASVDLDLAATARKLWGTFQTRRPGLYAPLGQVPAGPPPA